MKSRSADIEIQFRIRNYTLVQIPCLYVKKQESSSHDVNNIKSRSADIKIQFGVRNCTHGPNFKSIHKKRETWSNDIKSRSVDIKI